MKTVNIYTDGACRGNPGPGGWGVLIEHENVNKELFGGMQVTTNNQMELLAPIQALKKIPKGSKVEIFTDSKYVKSGITEWIHNWKKNGWKTANKKPVANKELWIELDTIVQFHNVQWFWVKGHSGNHYNEIADQLAVKAMNI